VPGSSRTESVGWLSDSLKAKMTAPTEKGWVVEAVAALLADHLRVDTFARLRWR
jgi:hypothetical protein